MATITINGVTLDPAAQAVALKSAKLLSADAHDSDYLLVQTKGPLTRNSAPSSRRPVRKSWSSCRRILTFATILALTSRRSGTYRS